jgi:hypothetical protein
MPACWSVLVVDGKIQGPFVNLVIAGSGAFVGLAGYTLIDGLRTVKANEQKILAKKSLFGIRTRQTGIVVASLSFLGIGVYRWVN